MIWIDKGAGPVALEAIQQNITTEHRLDFEASPDTYLAGTDKFDFPEDYKIQEVVETLRARQYNKCCFSEAYFTADYPHVEHFRPKGAVDAYPTGPRQFPGYYWLAYKWENLFLCKAQINTSFKRNFFPLADGSPRNRSHLDNHVEQPLIVDPGEPNPRNHIRFHEDEPYGITERGAVTVRLLGLRQPLLEEVRRTKLKVLKEMKQAVDDGLAEGMDINHRVLARLITALRSATEPSAEFSSMAIDLLSGWPPLA